MISRCNKRRVDRQAPAVTWSPDRLKGALAQGTTEEKVRLLKELGILTKDGRLSARYRTWGQLVSRTADKGTESRAGG